MEIPSGGGSSATSEGSGSTEAEAGTQAEEEGAGHDAVAELGGVEGEYQQARERKEDQENYRRRLTESWTGDGAI